MSAARRWIALASAVLLALLVAATSLFLGVRGLDPAEVLRAITGSAGGVDELVVLGLRLPRALIGIAAGAALGVSGAVIQSITRNPIADPGLLGVNAGASVGIVVAISAFGITRPLGYIWFGFAGAAAAALLVYVVARGRRGPSPLTLTLAGAAVTAALASLVSLVLLRDLDTLGQYRFWSVGSLVGRGTDVLAALAPFLLAGGALVVLVAGSLNLLALGDDVARGLGGRLGLVRAGAAAAVVLLCGSATAIAGPLAFVGLVVPHVARRLVGVDERWVLALSAPLGAALLVLADVVGRLVVPPGELEAGVVVAVVGAPVLIALVRRRGVLA